MLGATRTGGGDARRRFGDPRSQRRQNIGEWDIDGRCDAAAAATGADAIKLQTYTADTITLRSRTAPFMVGGGTIWEGKNLHELYAEAHTPWEWQPKLKQRAEALGLDVRYD